MARTSYPLGYSWEGVSQIDGSTPIVLIFTGYRRKSTNSKTGDMIQSWILPRDISPQDAVTSGLDASVCGYCPQRPSLDGTCYVAVGRAPNAVWKAFHRGRYKALPLGIHEIDELQDAFSGRNLRVGSWGDPAAVPLEIWETVIPFTAGRTGYTHQWMDPRFQDFREIIMASADSAADAIDAGWLGWRTFRVRSPGEELAMTGEFTCPASAEAGYRLTCERCQACDGQPRKGKASVVINGHGFRTPRVQKNLMLRETLMGDDYTGDNDA